MPVIVDPELGARQPAIITLSALIHGVHGNLAPLKVALPIVLALDDERRWRYASYILSALGRDQRATILGALNMQGHQISDIERRSIAFHDGREEGRLEVLRELVATILELRGFAVSAELRAQIQACTEAERLQRAGAYAREHGDPERLRELLTD